MKNSDVYYGIILFFIIKSILEIIGIIGSFLTIYLTLNLYFSSILVSLTAIVIFIICLRIVKFPIIMPWVLPIIILINMSIGYLDFPDKLIENYPILDRSMIFTSTKSAEQISILFFVIIVYIKYYRINKKEKKCTNSKD
ncbi:hypothetical protein [Bacteroides salyersiae]|uniref:hypothetical protein n=1 Tax=Bacteroides salyersiae TaxID=291644 RepID=UPI001C8C2813|nr:hypothetical protein [Bacteroides salyersiae]